MTDVVTTVPMHRWQEWCMEGGLPGELLGALAADVRAVADGATAGWGAEWPYDDTTGETPPDAVNEDAAEIADSSAEDEVGPIEAAPDEPESVESIATAFVAEAIQARKARNRRATATV